MKVGERVQNALDWLDENHLKLVKSVVFVLGGALLILFALFLAGLSRAGAITYVRVLRNCVFISGLALLVLEGILLGTGRTIVIKRKRGGEKR